MDELQKWLLAIPFGLIIFVIWHWIINPRLKHKGHG